MVAKKKISRLTYFKPREAWTHEAHDFTKWLFDNIDYLSDALGIRLEAVETETNVRQFRADVLAHDVDSDSQVLIENQLERADHKHLGQVLTYAAGLEANCVVWIATGFEDAHRSAIRWLNDNTMGHVAFFAVRLRVVGIGEKGPVAPVFEVVERPNSWERQIRADKKESSLTNLRRRFWEQYLRRHPDTFRPTRASNALVPITQDGSVLLSMYCAKLGSGMFLRGRKGISEVEFEDLIEDYVESLDKSFNQDQYPSYGTHCNQHTLDDEQNWDAIIDWLEEKRSIYETAFGN